MQKSTINSAPDHIVVRTAAPHMHKNYFRLFNANIDFSKFIYIDCFDRRQFTKIKKLSFWSIYWEFYLTYKELMPAIARLKKEEGRHSIAYEAMTALPIFSYFTCLLQELKKENAQIKLFSGGADLISSSAILSKIETYWLAHGLVAPPTLMSGKQIKPDPSKYNILLPKFNFIYLFSNDEVMFYRDHGISSKLCLYPYKKLNKLHRKIIIFLNDEDSDMNYKDLSELISLFKKHQYEIIIKFHPSYKGNFKKEFLNDLKIKIINDQDASALKLMLEEKPSFVAGWLSTTLCEAHLHGITPICLANPADSKYFTHQFHKKSIHWTESKKLLDESMANNIDTFEMLK
ncbi:alpha-2,8-polysialyltransferase family protein [Gammaproteobacteria bacterium]|nr:alpha-2,8-polysialyltransferase family protein [Gammaproteobacteria bacterium]